jgi:hypothetical protein
MFVYEKKIWHAFDSKPFFIFFFRSGIQNVWVKCPAAAWPPFQFQRFSSSWADIKIQLPSPPPSPIDFPSQRLIFPLAKAKAARANWKHFLCVSVISPPSHSVFQYRYLFVDKGVFCFGRCNIGTKMVQNNIQFSFLYCPFFFSLFAELLLLKKIGAKLILWLKHMSEL